MKNNSLLDLKEIENILKETIAELLGKSSDAPHDILDFGASFLELGINSVLAVEVVEALNLRLSLELGVEVMFDYRDIKELATFIFQYSGKEVLSGELPPLANDVRLSEEGHSGSERKTPLSATPEKSEESQKTSGGGRSSDIAIVGMSGRFAGSSSLEAFWSHLQAGENCIKEIRRKGWETGEVNLSEVKWGGILENIDQFDPLFFNISPLEAAKMDPQQRLFLEEAYKTIEDAGYSPEQLSGKRVGVFVGARASDYQEQALPRRDSAARLTEMDSHLFLGNDMAILAARVSYFLNCKGPSLTVDTACSSSLVAVHLACESIRTGESEMALAGGVFVLSSPEFSVMTAKINVLAPDGICRTFDNTANGTVIGEGVGAVLLKPLDQAIADGDHIHGVILGSALNQDGRTKGITAPSQLAQKALLASLYKRAAVDPETVSYIEAHGTGTRLGDPIEMKALTEAFRLFTGKTQFCAVGSLKPNFGHTIMAAGIAGLLKILMAMKYGQIPPTINLEQVNQQIDCENSPFFINTELRAWESCDGRPRRAGISSFGFSGTNCHVILEEPPPQKNRVGEQGRPSYFFPLSAKTSVALSQKVADLVSWLEKEGETYAIEDISYTLVQGRSHFPVRSAVVARDAKDLPHALRAMMGQGGSVHDIEKGKSSHTEETLRVYGQWLLKELQDNTSFTQGEYQEKLGILADLYMKGYHLDWGTLFDQGSYFHIPLPTYPFLGESYWIAETDASLRSKERSLSDAEASSLTQMGTGPVPPNANEDEGQSPSLMDTLMQRFQHTNQHIQGETLDAETRVGMQEMEELLYPLLWSSLQSLGLFREKHAVLALLREQAGISTSYDRWLQQSVALLERRHYLHCEGTPAEEDGRATCIIEDPTLIEMGPLWQRWDEHKERWMQNANLNARVVLVETMLRVLPAVLTGKRPAAEIMFPNGSMRLVEGIYQYNVIADYFNEVLAQFLVTYLHERLTGEDSTRLRILEIGAGTGGTTSRVLQMLQPYQRAVAEYCYSDISPAFLRYGQQRYGLTEHPYLTYQLFNVEKPLVEQGIEASGYDVVIAANALHATSNIRYTVRNARAALKEHGLLLLNEITDTGIFAHLAFGLLQGWWAYEDPELRVPGSPALTVENWKAVLSSEGFGAISIPTQEVQALGQQIIVAVGTGLAPALRGRYFRERNEHVGTGVSLANHARSENEKPLSALAPSERVRVAETSRGFSFGCEPLEAERNPCPDVKPTLERLAPVYDSTSPTGMRNDSYSVTGDMVRQLPVGGEPVGRNQKSEAFPHLQPLHAPANKMYKALSHVISDLLRVRVEEVDPTTELSEYGFDSITFMEFANRLNQTYELDLTPPLFYEHSTIERLVQYIQATYTKIPAPSPTEASPQQVMPVAPELALETTDEISLISTSPMVTTTPAPKPHSRVASSPVRLSEQQVHATASPIAIIGMSGVFPQAPDVQSLWSNLLEGRDCIGEIPPSRWDWQSYFGNPAMEVNKTNVKWAGIVEDVELFDPLFFGISPREAEQMDPQQRLLMMYVWKAIEDAGYSAESLSGTNTALFVGTMSSGYHERLSRANAVIEGYSSTGQAPSIGPNRMSYFLNLHGPSEAIETACSSSLVAIHRGVNALESGQCTMAIVGGVNTLVSPELHISYSKAGMLSEDGRCKTFSAQANGYVRGEGVGVLVLKKLCDAEQASDHIYGVIRGSAENHGGRATSLTAPNPRAQADLLIAAYRKAGIDPHTLGYIEAHGTGTPLGDPIEINGLKTAFSELAQTRGKGPMTRASCGIGSLKSNIGHLEWAAGVAGVIKVLLQMRQKKLVKSLHCGQINPYIQLEGSPFYIVQENQEWEAPRDHEGNILPRRAGVSSFGFGGANAHVVLEEYVAKPRTPLPENQVQQRLSGQAQWLIVLSARDEERLHAHVQQLLAWVQVGIYTEQAQDWREAQSLLDDLAYTLQVGRSSMEERLAFQVNSLQELGQKLRKYVEGEREGGDWYQGRVKRHDAINLFAADEDGQKAIAVWMSKGKYGKLLELWVKGGNIDWKHLYTVGVGLAPALPRRISLPTYPFARERYWLPTSNVGRGLVPLRNASDLSEQRSSSTFDGFEPPPTLLLTPGWKEEALASSHLTEEAPVNTLQLVLLYGFSDLLASRIHVQMAASGHHRELKVKHWHSSQLRRDLRFQDAVIHLIQELQSLWQSRSGGTGVGLAPVPMVPFLVQLVVQRGEPSFLEALVGVLKVAQQEYPQLQGQLIEVEGEPEEKDLLVWLRENQYRPQETHICYRDGKRWVRVWEELHERSAPASMPWKEGGCYLIAGGAGGLARLFVQEIARQVEKATIILVGRSALPANHWTQVELSESARIRIDYQQVDVSDGPAVRALLQKVGEQYGQLHGIIHAAGVVRNTRFLVKTQEEVREVLAPKVIGVERLDEESRQIPLDFFILCSSLTAVAGAVGLIDYAGANAYLDAFAHARQALVVAGERQGTTLSINWPLWQAGGMQMAAAMRDPVMRMLRVGQEPMETEIGMKILYQALASGFAQVIVLHGQVERIKQLLLQRPDPLMEADHLEHIPDPGYESEQGPCTIPIDKLREALAHMISDRLQVPFEKVNSETSLSEYGFDSITSMDFANYLNQTYKLDLSPAHFYEHSTIERLAQYLLTTYAAVLAPYFVEVLPNIASRQEAAPVVPGLAQKTVDEAPPIGGSQTTPTVSVPGPRSRLAHSLVHVSEQQAHAGTEPIAIIGMSGRFPLAADVQSLWRNLLEGRDCITEIPPSRWNWRTYFGDPATEVNKTNAKWAGVIEDLEMFDPQFFGISPREAEQMDPQQRLLMMYVWKAIEDAGYAASSLSGTDTALFVGTGSSGYNERLFQAGIAIEGYSSIGHIPSAGPNRMSYFLDLHGPSEAIETACSSSLVAIHRGIHAIDSGQCAIAIVGGVNTLVSPEPHISFSKAGLLCEDGRCKTFSAQANGIVRGEGVGMLVLKKLSAAEQAGDHIYGVIRGSAENHGGRASSFTAPNPRSQADLLIAAYRKAGIDPRTVSYIEAHGTGTALGDPIEINGLKTAFSELVQSIGGEPMPQASCGLGSLKSNIGHLEWASGVAGVIKVLLQLQHKRLVKSLHCEQINPYIQLEGSPFYIVQETRQWEALRDSSGNVLPRRAGVSSFGLGGINAHIVLEEYVPKPTAQPLAGLTQSPGRGQAPSLLVLSARNEERLHEQARQLLDWLQAEGCTEEPVGLVGSSRGQAPTLQAPDSTLQAPDHRLRDLAYTLQVGREPMEERLALQVNSLAELSEKLRRYLQEPQAAGDWYRGQVRKDDSIVAFAADEDGQKAVAAWMEKGKYGKLLDLWVKGGTIDWKLLYTVGAGSAVACGRGQAPTLQAPQVCTIPTAPALPRRISLPTYPFARERCWIPIGAVGIVQTCGASPQATADPMATVVGTTSCACPLPGSLTQTVVPLWDRPTAHAALHPLVQRNISDFFGQRFNSTFHGDEFFLTDHVVKGQRIMPGVAHLEMAYVAISQAMRSTVQEEGRRMRLTQITWMRPLVIDRQTVEVDITLELQEDQQVVFTISSQNHEMQDETPHIVSQGRALVGQAHKLQDPLHSLDLTAIQTRCQHLLTVSECYQYHREMGITHGPALQGIEWLSVGEGEVLARLSLPAVVAQTRTDFVLHPSVLDAALQACIGLLVEQSEPQVPQLPFALEELSLVSEVPAEGWAWVRRRSRSATGATFDIEVCDNEGRIALCLRGLSTRMLLSKDVSPTEQDAEALAPCATGLLISVPSSGSRKDVDSSRLHGGEVYTLNPNRSSGNTLRTEVQDMPQMSTLEGGRREADGGKPRPYSPRSLPYIPLWDQAFLLPPAEASDRLSVAQGTQATLPGNTANQVVIVGGTTNEQHTIAQVYSSAHILEIPTDVSIERLVLRLQELGIGKGTSPVPTAPFSILHAPHIFWLASGDPLLSPTQESILSTQQQGVLACFRLIKALLQLGYASQALRWTVVTRQTRVLHATETGDPSHASLPGLFGSLAKEYSHWSIQLVDLPVDTPLPLSEIRSRLPADPQGHGWLYRKGHWYRRILVPLDISSFNTREAYRRGGVYVIIGGAGGIGGVWSEHLIRKYQAQIIWIGRRKTNADILAKLERMATLGPRPYYITADATNRRALQQAYEEIKLNFGQIHGVVHSAIVLRDQSLANMDEKRFQAALAAKVDVSVRLAQVFEHEPLDFVLFFSALNAFVCNAGQSNYAAGCTFEDAFAARLGRDWSCAVKVINWGYWGSVGVVASQEYRERMAHSGLGSLEPEEAMEALEYLLASPVDQIVLLKTTKTWGLEMVQNQEMVTVYHEHFPSSLHRLNYLHPLLEWTRVPEAAYISYNGKNVSCEKLELQQGMQEMEGLLCKFLWSHLQSLGLFREKQIILTSLREQAGISASYDRWLQESVALLERQQYLHCSEVPTSDGHIIGTVSDPALVESATLWRQWDEHKGRWMENADLKAQVVLVETMLRALLAVLTGKRSATEVMFPDGSMQLVESIYRHNETADSFNEIIAQLVVTYLQERLATEEHTHIRILEIGAGTGGTTSRVLQMLQPYQAAVAEYCYSDISEAFLRYGQQTYAVRYPYLTYQLFNVEKPLAEQGIEVGSYDLVIAANVLHATSNVRHTVRNAKAALKKHGLLLLNEITGTSLFAHLTFGLLPGWWAYEDPELRMPGCPALTVENWEAVLSSEGFRAISFPSQDIQRIDTRTSAKVGGKPRPYIPYGQQVIVAESDGVVRQTLSQQSVEQMHTGWSDTSASTSQSIVQTQSKSLAPALDSSHFTTDQMVKDHVQSIIVESMAEVLRIREGSIQEDRNFSEYGVDSIVAINLINVISRKCHLALPTTVLFDYNTVEQLLQYLLREHMATLRAVLQENTLAGAAVEETSSWSRPRGYSQNIEHPTRRDSAVLPSAHNSQRRQFEPLHMPLSIKSGTSPLPIPTPLTYQCVILKRSGGIDDLTICEMDMPSLKDREVRIAVRAFSLNFGDLLCVKGLYPTMPPYPFTPGFEASGIVIAVGQAVTTFQPGDPVMAIAAATLGGQATVMTCPEEYVFHKPTALSFEEACALPAVALTMIAAFEKAHLKPGEKILIQAATSSIGLIAIQLAKHYQAEIYATAGSRPKLDYLKQLGVPYRINYQETDFAREIERLTEGKGVDVVINTLSGDAMQKGMNCLASGGRYIELAMTALKSARTIDLSVLSQNQTFYSIDLRKLAQTDPATFKRYCHEMLQLVGKGIIVPTICQVFDWERLKEAYRYMEKRQHIGKIVVRIPQANQASQGTYEMGNLVLPTSHVSTEALESLPRTLPTPYHEPIAIIGMSGRFARSKTVSELWEHLANGIDLVEEVSRWDLAELSPESAEKQEPYCKRGSFLEDIDLFDPHFFNISGLEAASMDPQQRLVLEESWKALEDAGYVGESIEGQRCGVYMGCVAGDYQHLFDSRPPAQALWGNAGSVIPARIAYYLNLVGPAIAIDTACSSSLVALHLACQSLWGGEIDMALAGGVFLQCTPQFYQSANRAEMLSPTGHCYTFDNRADGFVPGEGVGMVVLKRLKDALTSGDHIYGVIRGSGINQDGATRGITVPSANSQERLLRSVYETFRIKPSQIQMMEAHGTGTKLGDPIEFDALTRAFRQDMDQCEYCAIGSIKTNIGHTAEAAGVAGVIKILLSLQHKQIPPSLHFQSGNAHIQFKGSPFYVNTRLKDWTVAPEKGSSTRRCAAISSFGFSGTNAHMVIEEAPEYSRKHTEKPGYLIVLSARTSDQLQQQVEQFAVFCERSAELDCGNISYTLLLGRKHLKHRLACIVRSHQELVTLMRKWLEKGKVPQISVSNLENREQRDNASLRSYGNQCIENCQRTTEPKTYLEQLSTVAELYLQGYSLAFEQLFAGEEYSRVSLPTYPFARKRYWIPSGAVGIVQTCGALRPVVPCADPQATADPMATVVGSEQEPQKEASSLPALTSRVVLRPLADYPVHCNDEVSLETSKQQTLSAVNAGKPEESRCHFTVPQLEEELSRSLAQVLYIEEQSTVDVDTPFVEMGMDSVIGVQWIQSLNQQYASNMLASCIYDYPTIRQMAYSLHKELLNNETLNRKNGYNEKNTKKSSIQTIQNNSLDSILKQVQRGDLEIGKAGELLKQLSP